jgi:hypothetical protein
MAITSDFYQIVMVTVLMLKKRGDSPKRAGRFGWSRSWRLEGRNYDY